MKNKTKSELLEVIKKLRLELSQALDNNEDMYTDEQMGERYDQGYDNGFEDGKNESREYLSNSELSDFPNVLRFG